MQKRLYFGGCSFMENPNVFENTVLGDYFGDNCEIINNATAGSSNDQIFNTGYDSYYHEILTQESNDSILKTSNLYTAVVANDKKHNRYCHLEPEGTDNLIRNTIILHQLLNSKNIPHLFISMGDVIYKTLDSRRGWFEFIDKKNYFGEHDDLAQRMANGMSNNFRMEHANRFGENFHDSTYFHPESLIRDNAAHLSQNGGKVLAKKILDHIVENKIV